GGGVGGVIKRARPSERGRVSYAARSASGVSRLPEGEVLFLLSVFIRYTIRALLLPNPVPCCLSQSSVSAQLRALQELLQLRFPDAAPLTQRTTQAVPTGLAPLDEALPSGGLPRGKLTVWEV